MMFIVDISWSLFIVMIVAVAIFLPGTSWKISVPSFFPSRWFGYEVINQLFMAMTSSCVQVVVKNGPVTSGASLRTPWKVLAAHTARKGMERGQNFEKPEIFCPFFSSNPQWHGPRWSS